MINERVNPKILKMNDFAKENNSKKRKASTSGTKTSQEQIINQAIKF